MFGSVWSSMRRGHSFHRTKSANVNATDKTNISTPFLPYNSIRPGAMEGMNNVSPRIKAALIDSRASLTHVHNQEGSNEEESMPLRSLNTTRMLASDGDKDNFEIVG